MLKTTSRARQKIWVYPIKLCFTRCFHILAVKIEGLWCIKNCISYEIAKLRRKKRNNYALSRKKKFGWILPAGNCTLPIPCFKRNLKKSETKYCSKHEFLFCFINIASWFFLTLTQTVLFHLDILQLNQVAIQAAEHDIFYKIFKGYLWKYDLIYYASG